MIKKSKYVIDETESKKVETVDADNDEKVVDSSAETKTAEKEKKKLCHNVTWAPRCIRSKPVRT